MHMNEINQNIKKSRKVKECGIVKDLIPLYADDIASEESRNLVERHMKQCAECRHELELLKSPMLRDKEIENSVKYIKAFKENKKRQKRAFYMEMGLYIIVALLFIIGIKMIYSHVVLGDVHHVKVEISSSEEYSKSELEKASEAVLKYFQKHYKGCKLLSLTYDETYSKEWAEVQGEIVFEAEFRTKSSAVPFEQNTTYSGWNFSVRYDKKEGKWIVTGAGVC